MYPASHWDHRNHCPTIIMIPKGIIGWYSDNVLLDQWDIHVDFESLAPTLSSVLTSPLTCAGSCYPFTVHHSEYSLQSKTVGIYVHVALHSIIIIMPQRNYCQNTLSSWAYNNNNYSYYVMRSVLPLAGAVSVCSWRCSGQHTGESYTWHAYGSHNSCLLPLIIILSLSLSYTHVCVFVYSMYPLTPCGMIIVT